MLVQRQERLYEDTCSIYRPRSLRKDVNSTLTGASAIYEETPIATEVPCLLIMKSDVTEALKAPIGRFPDDMIFTLDHWHFTEAQDVRVNDVIKLTTPGRADINTYWVITSIGKFSPMRARRRANRRLMLGRVIEAPRFTT